MAMPTERDDCGGWPFRRRAAIFLAAIVALAELAGSAASVRAAPGAPEPREPIPLHVGAGNFPANESGEAIESQYRILASLGARMVRINAIGWRKDGRLSPESLDAAVEAAWRHGVAPIILLEYQGSWSQLTPPQPIGSRDEWYSVGRALAARFGPKAAWARAHGVGSLGVRIFEAINEPDVENTIAKDDYREALAGLAAGVHSVDRSLRVIPGGFGTCNSAADPTLRGYGPAIADLLNHGELDGIDLHTYYDVRWFPINQGQSYSAQSCFDRVKQASGITRDIRFYTTEFNIAAEREDGSPMADADAGRYFLTALWDNLAVVGAAGAAAGVIAFPWNLFDTPENANPAYAMSATASPWRPGARDEVLRLALRLADGMTFRSIDRRRGRYELRGHDRVLIVWQDLPGWTDASEDGIAIRNPKPVSRILDVWGAGGKQRSLTVGPGEEVRVADLPPHQTWMFLLR